MLEWVHSHNQNGMSLSKKRKWLISGQNGVTENYDNDVMTMSNIKDVKI